MHNRFTKFICIFIKYLSIKNRKYMFNCLFKINVQIFLYKSSQILKLMCP